MIASDVATQHNVMTDMVARRPRIVRTVLALRRIIKHYRGASETIALVPTMGAPAAASARESFRGVWPPY